MITTENFRRILQQTLMDRVKKNPHYSIRAFAKALGIESSSLSQMINGQRPITQKMRLRLSDKLGLPPETHTAAYENFVPVDVEVFKIISDWYHYAILELTHLDHFKPQVKWVAKVLGLSINEVHDAVRRLRKLDMLGITADGQWKDLLGDANNLGNEFTAPAFRKLQKQFLEKAIYALENTPYEKRVQTSITVPVAVSRVAPAKKRILKFIEELHDYLRSGDSRDEVYHMSLSLYPVSNTGEHK